MKYSKYMPQNLLSRYHEFINDPEITSSKSEIAILDSHLSELTQQVDTDISSMTWAELKKLWARFMLAVRTGDGVTQAKMVTEIDDMINRHTKNDKVWADIERVSLSRAKLAEAEHKRLVQNHQMLTVEQAMNLIGALIVSIKDVVYLYADDTTAKHIIAGTSRAYTNLIGSYASDSGSDPGVIDG